MEDLSIVPKADAGEFAGHQAVVLPERQQNDIDERIDGEDQKTDEKREQEQPRLRKRAEGHARGKSPMFICSPICILLMKFFMV